MATPVHCGTRYIMHKKKIKIQFCAPTQFAPLQAHMLATPFYYATELIAQCAQQKYKILVLRTNPLLQCIILLIRANPMAKSCASITRTPRGIHQRTHAVWYSFFYVRRRVYWRRSIVKKCSCRLNIYNIYTKQYLCSNPKMPNNYYDNNIVIITELTEKIE